MRVVVRCLETLITLPVATLGPALGARLEPLPDDGLSLGQLGVGPLEVAGLAGPGLVAAGTGQAGLHQPLVDDLDPCRVFLTFRAHLKHETVRCKPDTTALILIFVGSRTPTGSLQPSFYVQLLFNQTRDSPLSSVLFC